MALTSATKIRNKKQTKVRCMRAQEKAVVALTFARMFNLIERNLHSLANGWKASTEIIADALAGAGRSAGRNTASPRRMARLDTMQVPEELADRRRQRCSP